MLLVKPYSSLDDAIDTVNIQGAETLLALYVFAAPAPANYLAQFISTQASFVNYIPGDLLGESVSLGRLYLVEADHRVTNPLLIVGPALFPTLTAVRYTRPMFEVASPQFVRSDVETLGTAMIVHPNQTRADQIYTDALKPLKPTGQREAGDVNFFIQALRASALVFVLPIVSAALAGSVWTGVSVYRWFRGGYH